MKKEYEALKQTQQNSKKNEERTSKKLAKKNQQLMKELEELKASDNGQELANKVKEQE